MHTLEHFLNFRNAIMREKLAEEQEGILAPSSMYDLVQSDGTLYRATIGVFTEVLMHSPLPERFWALPRIERKEMSKGYIERIRVFGSFVRDLTTLSKCQDKGVAAIIINADASQVYSIGLNGGPKGGLDCLCQLNGKYSCIHAEANALAKCNTADQHKIMICTLSPCVTCASLIANNGFDTVYFLDRYRDDLGLRILKEASINVQQLRSLTEDPLGTDYSFPVVKGFETI